MNAPPRRPVPGVIVAHGNLASELRCTAESIAGAAADVACFTNAGLSTEDLAAQIGQALEQTGPGTIIMVDLAGGSCLSAALRASRHHDEVHIVAGINLPLVLDFIQKRETMTSAELLDHLLTRGQAGLKAVTTRV